MSDDDLDLSAVAADAALLDALAAGVPGAADDAVAGLAALRAALDEDLRLDSSRTPMQAAPVGEVVGLRRPSGRRSGGRAAALVAGAALALSSTGVAAATYEARPGDAFYGLRTAVAGPRAEDPQLLRERLDAVQQRLRAADPASRESAREELAEVATLLDALDPELRAPLEQRHAALTERLAATDGPPAQTPSTGAPSGPPAGVPTGPPAGQPGPPTERPGPPRTPDSGPEPTRGPQSAPPAERPSATPEPTQDRPSPQGERSSPGPTASPREERPSPRSTQAASPSRAPLAGQPDGVAVPGRPAPASTEELMAPG